MVQLRNDCLIAGEDLILLEEAVALIKARLTPQVLTKKISLLNAMGTVLAEDIYAHHATPPYDNAAVDGYAVNAHSLDNLEKGAQIRLSLIGRAAAGHPFMGEIKKGEAVKIFTGAALPKGADLVYMLEDVEILNDHTILCPHGLKLGSNIRRLGEDVAKDSLLIKQGKRLDYVDIGLLAGQGLSEILIYQPLKVAVFSSGDEVVDAGQKLGLGKLYDMNRPMLINWLQRLGFEVTDMGILPDNAIIVEDSLIKASLTHQAILTSGGMSMGEEDHIKNCLEKIGQLSFWRIGIKPGRPIGLGIIQNENQAQSCLVIGLPGNVVASFTTFALIARPALKILAGEVIIPLPRYQVYAGMAYKKKKGRREFIRVKLTYDQNEARLYAHQYGRNGAGILSSVAGADGFIELDENTDMIEKGMLVSYISFESFF